MPIKKIHVASNTHWDREHRVGFQENRMNLVVLIDELLDIMENDPEYRYFTLDGQAILLEDYLEVKPQMKKRLMELIISGRLLVGPWYSLVDCTSVMPESIIRNLLKGQSYCRKFGGCMKTGYSIFSFGQIAQLPQIYAGFGIKDILFYKNPPKELLPESEFIWKAPDGTRAFASRLGKQARWNFFYTFDIPVILGGDARREEWQGSFSEATRVFHPADLEFKDVFSTELDQDVRIRKENIRQAVLDILESVEESASENIFLAFDGTDFTSPLRQIPEAIRAANEIMAGEVELVHSNPSKYLEEVKIDICMETLTEYVGEMSSGPVSHIQSEIMGVNTDLKQALYHAENSLINHAEPLLSFLYANGGNCEKDALEYAWKQLLASQAHDSIHGAGVPKMKRDQLYRLEQVKELVGYLTVKAAGGIAGLIDMKNVKKDEIPVVIFNTTPYERSEVFTLVLDIPKDDFPSGYWLEDTDGNRVEHYELSTENFSLALINRNNRPKPLYSLRVKLDAYIEGIPTMGYKLLKLKWIPGVYDFNNCFSAGKFPYKPIGISGNILDNGLIRVVINSNGTINVINKENGKTFEGLHYFTDSGCSGDFWIHRTPKNNSLLSSKGSGARMEMVKNSGLSATCRVTVPMEIPESLNESRTTRSSRTITVLISSDITVNKGSRRIDIKTVLRNESKDHMLTVNFPVDVKTEIVRTECPFEIRNRKIGGSSNNGGLKGPELQRHPIQGFADISDDTNGLALFTKGLREIGTAREDTPVLNLTLLRSCALRFPVDSRVFLDFKDDNSQCIGEHVFEYSLFIHCKSLDEGGVIPESRKYAVSLLAAEVGRGSGGVLNGDQSLFRLEDEKLTISAVKPAEDGNGIIIRLSNITDKVIVDKLVFFTLVQEAYVTDSSENKAQKIDIDGDSFPVILNPYRVETYKIVYGEERNINVKTSRQ